MNAECAETGSTGEPCNDFEHKEEARHLRDQADLSAKLSRK